MNEVTRINGKDFETMMAGGVAFLAANEEVLNNLNVFPVPDGDTGTNMASTARGAANAKETDSLGAYVAAAANGMMRESRGNSGVIMSLFFRGMAKALAGMDSADSALLLEAFRQGYKGALSAVAKPMEGTILTVMRECCADPIDTPYISELLGVILQRAEETLAKTPEMLPALKRAHVVDSGGQGFVFIVQGMKLAFDGEELPQVEANTPAMGVASEGEGTEEEITFGFCTEALLDRTEGITDEQIEAFRAKIADMGDSMVFVMDEAIIKLHIHTNEPMVVISGAMELGTIVKVKVENMRVQHTSFIQKDEAAEAAPEPVQKEASEEKESKKEGFFASVAASLSRKKDPAELIDKPFGMVSVCEGDGMMDAFRQAGVLAIVDGGKSMNPSIGDIIKGIRECQAETVYVLPNNKNTVMAAEQAAELCTECTVKVIKSVTMIEGISAAMVFNGNRSIEENERLMNEAAKSVQTLSFSRAAKDAEMEDVVVRKKQYIGILGGKLLTSEDTMEDSVKALVELAGEADFYTVYYGHGVKVNDAALIAAAIEEVFEDADVALVNGGQKLYPYIISAE